MPRIDICMSWVDILIGPSGKYVKCKDQITSYKLNQTLSPVKDQLVQRFKKPPTVLKVNSLKYLTCPKQVEQVMQQRQKHSLVCMCVWFYVQSNTCYVHKRTLLQGKGGDSLQLQACMAVKFCWKSPYSLSTVSLLYVFYPPPPVLLSYSCCFSHRVRRCRLTLHSHTQHSA